MKMKKTLTVIAATLLIATACLGLSACVKPQTAELSNIDYAAVLADYLAYPDAENVASMQTKRADAKEDPVDVKAIYEDSSLSVPEKIAQMVYGATMNEIACDHFAYFRNQVGTTKIGKKSGTLVYQRLRRQDDRIKDDTTIKLPINHNFGTTESSFVTSADIRYISEGSYKRMNNRSDIIYDENTGLLTVEKWKKQSNENWNRTKDGSGDAKGSRSIDEARKTVINWKAQGIVKAEGAKIELKEDANGNYYALTFSVDVAVANADKPTISALENDNSGKNMSFQKCDLTVEIWECGLAKRYYIEETWKGEIGAAIIWYAGAADSKSEIIFSYSQKDMDYSKTEAVYKSIK